MQGNTINTTSEPSLTPTFLSRDEAYNRCPKLVEALAMLDVWFMDNYEAPPMWQQASSSIPANYPA